MQSTNYVVLYLVIVGAKYFYRHILIWKKYKSKKRRPDQTVVERFCLLWAIDLNGPVQFGKFSYRNFLFVLILVSDQTKSDRMHP